MCVKEILHEAESEVPFQRLRQHFALPVLLRYKVFQLLRQWDAQVEQLFVEKSDQIILLTHYSVRNVMCVELSCRGVI